MTDTGHKAELKEEDADQARLKVETQLKGLTDGSRLKGLLTRDNNYFNNEYITGALSPEGIISGWWTRRWRKHTWT
jgi:hypothetical protein